MDNKIKRIYNECHTRIYSECVIQKQGELKLYYKDHITGYSNNRCLRESVEVKNVRMKTKTDFER